MFPIAKKKDEKTYGDCRTKNIILDDIYGEGSFQIRKIRYCTFIIFSLAFF